MRRQRHLDTDAPVYVGLVGPHIVPALPEPLWYPLVLYSVSPSSGSDVARLFAKPVLNEIAHTDSPTPARMHTKTKSVCKRFKLRLRAYELRPSQPGDGETENTKSEISQHIQSRQVPG